MHIAAALAVAVAGHRLMDWKNGQRKAMLILDRDQERKMLPQLEQEIRDEVVGYLRQHSVPVRMSAIIEGVRHKKAELKRLRDADIKAVILPMITTGKLKYTPELMICLAHKGR